MMKRRKVLLGIAATSALAMLTACGGAADGSSSSASAGGKAFTPKGDVTMVVPFGAGGGSDISGRAIAAGLEAASPGLHINTENREGGSGAVGYSYFLSKKGKANYLLATETALLALPADTKVSFTYKSFTPIMKVGDDYTLAVVPAKSPWKTCMDVVNASKAGRVIAGISGATGLDNVVFTLTEQKNGAKFDRVPFESGDELKAALLGNQIQVASLNPSEVTEQLKAGALRALCVFGDKRYDYPDLKDIPTAKEQGIDVSFAQYRGLLAPGGIDADAKKYWIDVAKKFTESPEYKKYVDSEYLQPNALFGDDFTAYLAGNDTLLRKALGK